MVRNETGKGEFGQFTKFLKGCFKEMGPCSADAIITVMQRKKRVRYVFLQSEEWQEEQSEREARSPDRLDYCSGEGRTPQRSNGAGAGGV